MKLAVIVAMLAACGGSEVQFPPLVDAIPYVPNGCVTDVSIGDHTFTCGGLQVDARIPRCPGSFGGTEGGCGLILVLHGDTGSGLLMDGHVAMRERGEQNGYIVVAPTGPPFGGGSPGSTWHQSNDATLIDIVTQFAAVFRVDPKRIHVIGFSRGSFVTWRLLCDHADLFASAAPGGGGDGSGFGEQTCFSQNRTPSREIPIVFLMGRNDASVGYPSLVTIRDAAIASYGATGPETLESDATFTHDRWTNSAGTTIETFDHAYETVSDGPFGSARGHCIPGSTTDPYAAQYAIPCKLPNSFVWGERAMTFFQLHPMN